MCQLFRELGVGEEQQPVVYHVHFHYRTLDPSNRRLLRQHSALRSKLEGRNDELQDGNESAVNGSAVAQPSTKEGEPAERCRRETVDSDGGRTDRLDSLLHSGAYRDVQWRKRRQLITRFGHCTQSLGQDVGCFQSYHLWLF